MIPTAHDPATADLLLRAAKGDRVAQTGLVAHAIGQFEAGNVSYAHSVCVAEAWARLAASHGGIEERRRLAGILLLVALYFEQSGEPDQAFESRAESIAIYTELADDGDEQSADIVQRYAPDLSAHVLKGADCIVRHYSMQVEN